MDDLTLARVVHLLAVLLWIGGVAFVTTVVIPSVRKQHPPDERLGAFHRLEARFAPQARVWVLLAGASGLWMAWRADLWDRFAKPGFWWMHAMVLTWLLFAAMLFVLEPLALHRRMAESVTPARDFDRLELAHRLLFALSLVTFAAAAAGSHGLI
jgi:uncharacterized membrane protein